MQTEVGPAAVRFLVENAGSMQKMHLEAFCKLLSLPLTHDRDYIWDPAQYGYLEISSVTTVIRNLLSLHLSSLMTELCKS